MERHPWSWIGFNAWVILTAFFVLNLMIAVICESLIELQNTHDSKRQDKALKAQKKLVSNQTEYLLSETRKVLSLQREILARQDAMQELLLDVAASTGVPIHASLLKNTTSVDSSSCQDIKIASDNEAKTTLSNAKAA